MNRIIIRGEFNYKSIAYIILLSRHVAYEEIQNYLTEYYVFSKCVFDFTHKSRLDL